MFSTRKRSPNAENLLFSNKTLPSSPAKKTTRFPRKHYTQASTPTQQNSPERPSYPNSQRVIYSGRKVSRRPFEHRLKKLSSISNLPGMGKDKSLRETDDSTRTFSKKRRNITINDFVLVRPVGRGKSGTVFLAVHKATGFVGALKIFSKGTGLEHSQERHMSALSSFIRQLKIQSYAIHSDIVQVYAIFDDATNIYLFMELGVDGQLFDRMQPNQARFKEETVALICKSLLSALQFLHSKRILHRDLKPQNVVLIHGCPKICDFGESNVCDTERGQLRQTLCGTPLYLSPEILQGYKYNQKIDIWALGALTYELLTGTNPFDIQTRSDLCKIVTDSFKMTDGSVEVRNFLSHCLKKNPVERPKATKLLRHPFITKWHGLETAEELCG